MSGACLVAIALVADARAPGGDLSTSGRAQFGEDVRHVRADRLRGEHKSLGDLVVRQAIRDEAGHLELALAQWIPRLSGPLRSS